jgi:hypothetical protein
VTPAGKIERLEVPRDREGEFVTEVFERYKWMTADLKGKVLVSIQVPMRIGRSSADEARWICGIERGAGRWW